MYLSRQASHVQKKKKNTYSHRRDKWGRHLHPLKRLQACQKPPITYLSSIANDFHSHCVVIDDEKSVVLPAWDTWILDRNLPSLLQYIVVVTRSIPRY